jgi:hypothetical protein
MDIKGLNRFGGRVARSGPSPQRLWRLDDLPPGVLNSRRFRPAGGEKAPGKGGL